MAASTKSDPVAKRPLRQYAGELRQWLHWTKHCQWANYSYQAMLLNQFMNPSPPRVYLHDGNHNIINSDVSSDQPSQSPTPPTGINHSLPRVFPMSAGTEAVIPSVWKRLVAEIIDCGFLLLVKFFISYLLVTYGGFKAVQVLDFDYAFLNGEIDLERFYTFSQDIVVIEFIHRILVSIYEALCLVYVTNIYPPGGFTIGKRLMGLSVVACDEVFSIGHGRFLLTRARNLTFFSAVSRSLIKNLSLSLMIPSSLTMFMADNRRTVYDIVTGTVVIEAL